MERALRPLRTLQPDRRIDFKELVILGAQAKAGQSEPEAGGPDERHRALVERFLALRADDRIDVAAGLALHDSGWAHAG